MFYAITQKPTALGIRLSPKNPDKRFYPKWRVKGQGEDYVAVVNNIPFNTVGLLLADGHTLHREGMDNPAIPCVLLLIGENRLYVPEQSVRVISDEELKKELQTADE